MRWENLKRGSIPFILQGAHACVGLLIITTYYVDTKLMLNVLFSIACECSDMKRTNNRTAQLPKQSGMTCGFHSPLSEHVVTILNVSLPNQLSFRMHSYVTLLSQRDDATDDVTMAPADNTGIWPQSIAIHSKENNSSDTTITSNALKFMKV